MNREKNNFTALSSFPEIYLNDFKWRFVLNNLSPEIVINELSSLTVRIGNEFGILEPKFCSQKQQEQFFPLDIQINLFCAACNYPSSNWLSIEFTESPKVGETNVGIIEFMVILCKIYFC